MDYDKEFKAHWASTVVTNGEWTLLEISAVVDAYYAGAKRAEELLLADQLVVDLRGYFDRYDYIKSIKIDGYGDDGEIDCTIYTIPRPKPTWVPKVGEAVFGYSNTTDIVYAGTFKTNNFNGSSFDILVGGQIFEVHEIKPFTPENIGKRWEDIRV